MASQGNVAGVIDETTGVPPQWSGLSRHLIARIFRCDSKGVEIPGGDSILGPITDANLEFAFNWQSPFENTGPESKLPALMSLIQSGQLGVIVNALQAAGIANEEGSMAKGLADSVKNAAKELEGRTGITKLNSRQVFSGMQPVKLPITMHFRAWSNPAEEVERPYRRLLEWALPQKLAEDGFLAQAIKESPTDGAGLLRAMFPSEAPVYVGMTYGNLRYSPMVIEAISHQVDGPMDSDGVPIYRAIQISLSTLTALDKNDAAKLFLKG